MGRGLTGCRAHGSRYRPDRFCRGPSVQFHAIASTGRTATTFLARALDSLDGVAACHEGYRAAEKASGPLLPLINLENRQAYLDPDKARALVASKRGVEALQALELDTHTLVDVAYYNPVIAMALLEAHPSLRLVAIIRGLEPFVRSATAMEGEDLLPVGWPRPDKPLTPREKFIEIGRIKPGKDSSEAEQWDDWSAIMRNIWLWRETNSLLMDAKRAYPDRVLLLRFEQLSAEALPFMMSITDHLGLSGEQLVTGLDNAQGHRNRKASGYQIGPMSEWSDEERAFAEAAQTILGKF